MCGVPAVLDSASPPADGGVLLIVPLPCTLIHAHALKPLGTCLWRSGPVEGLGLSFFFFFFFLGFRFF